MGYYTDYELTVEFYARDKLSGKETYRSLDTLTAEEISKELDKMGVFDTIDLIGGWCYANCKWYEHDHDMLLLSWKFPDVLFTLHGIGENSDDMWYAYYLNGKMQYCPAQIEYDEFSAQRLDDPAGSAKFLPSDKYSYE